MRSLTCLLAAAAVASCSCGPTNAASKFCYRALDAQIDRVVGCVGGTRAFWSEVSLRDPFCAEIARGEKAGRIEYDGKEGDAYLAEVKAASCGQFFDGVDPQHHFYRALKGTVAKAGDPCYGVLDCAPPNTCQYTASTTGIGCPGHCSATSSGGTTCRSDVDCNLGLVCFQGTCLDPATGLGGEGDSCQYQACHADFYCDATRTCRRRLADLPCTQADQCVFSEYCNPSYGRCVPWLQENASCSGEDCDPFGLFCDSDLTCHPDPGPGGACGKAGVDQAVYCVGGWCSAQPGNPGACQNYLAVGQPCGNSYQCGYTGFCWGYTHKCATVCGEQ